MPTDNPSLPQSDQTPSPQASPQPPEACQQPPPKKPKVRRAIGAVLGVTGVVAVAGLLITQTACPGARVSSRLSVEQRRAEQPLASQVSCSQPTAQGGASNTQAPLTKESP